ncbi:MAG: peptidoglycan-binding domain-containing protein [Acidimicrobiales bacterium]
MRMNWSRTGWRSVLAAVATTSLGSTLAVASAPPDEITPVSYREPPPLIHPVPFAEVEVGDDPSVVTWVAIANDGGAVVGELESDTVRVVRPDGTVEAPIDVGTAPGWLVVGPGGDVLYGIHSSTRWGQIVAIALTGDRAGETVASRVIDESYNGATRFAIGQGATGVIGRARNPGEVLMPYVDAAGNPTGEVLPVPYLSVGEDDAVTAVYDPAYPPPAGTVTAWALQVERAPGNPIPGDGPDPAVASPAGGGFWETWIGPPQPGEGEDDQPTMPVLGELLPDGGARWWTVPDDWHVEAMDLGGVLFTRETGGVLELARLGDAEPVGASPSEPTCTGIPAGATFVVPDGEGVALARADGNEPLTLHLPSEPKKAVRGPDGTIWAEVVGDDGVEVYRVPDGGEAALSASGDVELASVGWIDDRTAAVIIDRERPDGAEEYGAVLVEYADGEQVDVGPSGGPEYGAASVSIGAGRLVEGASLDLGEGFDYYGLDGESLTDWFDPTDTAEYNAPPFFQWPIAMGAGADSDEVTLSWVEGPDWDGATGEQVGGWELVLADAATGAESLRLDLDDPGEVLLHADFDGLYWVGTFGTTAEEGPDGPVYEPERVLVVSPQADSPAVLDAGCPEGVIPTLDRREQAPPVNPPPTTTAPPTPAAPPPTAAGCDSYVTPENEYPIRLCDKGFTVEAIQVQLVANGYDVETDGYFGPLTEQAVRHFQADNGLDVDGLVGPDTWSALYTGDPPAVHEDGNGVVDPWEVEVYPDDSGPDDSGPEGRSH